MSIDYQRTSLEEAIRNCRARARVCANLAAAFFDLGCSALLLGNSSESLAAYSKACKLSETEEPIEAALRSLTRLEEFAGVSHQEIRCTGRLLFVARVGKLLSLEENARRPPKRTDETDSHCSARPTRRPVRIPITFRPCGPSSTIQAARRRSALRLGF